MYGRGVQLFVYKSTGIAAPAAVRGHSSMSCAAAQSVRRGKRRFADVAKVEPQDARQDISEDISEDPGRRLVPGGSALTKRLPREESAGRKPLVVVESRRAPRLAGIIKCRRRQLSASRLRKEVRRKEPPARSLPAAPTPAPAPAAC